MHKKKIRTVYTINGYLFSGVDMVTIFPLYSTCPAHSICFIYSVIGLNEFPSKNLSCRHLLHAATAMTIKVDAICFYIPACEEHLK